ncbi:MAG: hypothetical protein HZA54_02935 [Planctomycetes bacterium]|nr:hypothetical protein [Planctomycetota bacterium]
MEIIGETYRPDGGIAQPVTLLGGLVAALLVALLLGAAMSFVGQWLYLILLFPAIAGGLIGAVGHAAVDRAQVRHRFLAATLLFFIGLLGYAAYQVGEYQLLLHRMRTGLAADGVTDPKEQAETIDEFFREKYAATGFAGYLRLAAAAGVTISRSRSQSRKDSGPTLTGLGWWLYVGVEALIVAGMAAGIAWGAAARPFCEPCSAWLPDAVPVFRADPAREPELLGMLRSGGLKALVGRPPDLSRVPPTLELSIQLCRTCRRTGFGDLVLIELDKKKNPQRKNRATHVRLPAGQGLALVQMVGGPSPDPPVAGA